MIKGKNILLGVTGGIAAYKSAMIIRLLVKEGATVKVVMTPVAREFITPLTLATLSKNPILVDFFDPEDGRWNSHVDLGLWADAFLVAPATANTIAKMASGTADNLLLTTYLSAKCPVFIAPAMDLDMFAHPATQLNLNTLASRGVKIIDAGTGELASGLEGKGRMAEPQDIARELTDFFSKKKRLSLKGKRILVNAGPTYENIDPVRFIGNYSSGKMGIALANAAAERGAEVTLVLGPTSLSPGRAEISVVNVTSASEMASECIKYFPSSDIAILAAAVADFTPSRVSGHKIKKSDKDLTLLLVPTIDIASTLGAAKSPAQLVVGFALETEDEEINARAKLVKKSLDLVVLNSLSDIGAGFGHDTNIVSLIDKSNIIDKFELKSKEYVAEDILDKIESLLKKRVK
ncbi:MAG: bifunctional phosphopantothenoylcysteine decarboxylase/phosphopantothenate--cysteine ligase CoaBC [Bacteroidia bacterium]|nr:MAG: bifunctional phosphopantothenoylcysteine decarboxylase/phosphopantothenate--cysteine ligase CoaBC [Bacteroidia bacterium]